MVDKDRIQEIAEELANKEYGCEFYDLPEPTRDKVFVKAEELQADEEADKAERMIEKLRVLEG